MSDTTKREAALMTDTQPMDIVPPAPDQSFSQWTHYNPILVEALAAHANVPMQEVVDHLRSLFDDVYEGRIPGIRPLDRPAWVLNRYLNEYVAVG